MYYPDWMRAFALGTLPAWLSLALSFYMARQNRQSQQKAGAKGANVPPPPYWPWVALSALAVLLALLPIKWKAAKEPKLSSATHPLLGDGFKWQIAEHLRNDFSGINSKCQVVIVYYPGDYSEHFGNDIGAIIKHAGGNVQTQLAKKPLDPGIKILSPPTGDQKICADLFKKRLETDLGEENDQYRSIDLKIAPLGKSYEIDIGEKPG
jgi:hypothetical protein